jgi:small subunit ribosomal protein S9
MADQTNTQQRYIEAVGRRKTAVARVRLYPDTQTSFIVNDAALKDYFPTHEQQTVATEALQASGIEEPFRVSVRIYGGGEHAQAEAMRHGVARALVAHDPELRTTLKKAGYLKRDPRMKERKKFGLRKARRRPQWSKR